MKGNIIRVGLEAVEPHLGHFRRDKMGQPVPKDMDGKVLLDLIEDSFKKDNPVRFV